MDSKRKFEATMEEIRVSIEGFLNWLRRKYDVSDKQLTRLLDELLADEFKSVIESQFPIKDKRLLIYPPILKRRDKIWTAVKPQLDIFNDLLQFQYWVDFSYVLSLLVIVAMLIYLSLVNSPILAGWLSPFIEIFNLLLRSNIAITSLNLFQVVVPTVIVLLIVGIRPTIRVYSISNKRVQLKNEIDTAVFAVLRFEVRDVINNLSKISYKTTLDVKEAKGLEEGYDRALEVDTEARQYTEKLLINMRHGSVGIAGPRGTGKTTLLFSARDFKTPGKEKIYVHVAAPEKYNAREFILHLFSEVCRAVINKLDPDDNSAQQIIVKKWLPYLFLGNIIRPKNLSLIILVSVLLSLGITYIQQTSTIALGQVGITQEIITTGMQTLLIILAIVFFMSAYVSLLSYVANHGIWLFTPKSPVRRSLILKKTYDEYKKIKFQQTFSEGWGGKLNLAVFEATSEKAESLQAYEMTLPDVTFAYRKYVENLSERFQFIIAIDELDKIEDVSDAQSFLNDLKNVLSLKNSFYLVSVSQNAMSNFELRGLPFRDAFDSTFDEIVYVNYLDFEKSREIIRRRIIGMDEPFLQLAFCLSGGLPRDLIRVARKMILLSEQIKDSSLGGITLSILCEDVIKKMNAARHQILENDLVMKSSKYLLKMDSLQQNFAENNLEKIGSEFMSDGANEVEPKLQALIYHFGVYLMYVATLLSFYKSTRKTHDFKMVEKTYLDNLVKARQRMGISGEYAVKLINEFRAECGLSAIPMNIS